MTVRGWDSRRPADPITGSYQAPCGHYMQTGQYACSSCNIAPLSELLAAEEAGKTLAAYVYSIVNPGVLPETVKAAIRTFEG